MLRIGVFSILYIIPQVGFCNLYYTVDFLQLTTYDYFLRLTDFLRLTITAYERKSFDQLIVL